MFIALRSYLLMDMITVQDIASTIEEFAPKSIQESYDNTGLQIGDPTMVVKGIMICLDVTEEILSEAIQKNCNLIISHHPLLFTGLKDITGRNNTQRIVIKAIQENIAIYSAHTNLDSAKNGVSYEIANILGLSNVCTLCPSDKDSNIGLGAVGEIQPMPVIEFLRLLKEKFNVKALKYSALSPQIEIKKVAICGGSGASLINDAIKTGADIYITGDIKYHDITTYCDRIIIADIGHYESELCTKMIFKRIISEKFVNFATYLSESEKNPINYI